MLTPDPATVLFRQAALFGAIDRLLDALEPDFGPEQYAFAGWKRRRWMLDPFLELGRYLMRRPDDDQTAAPLVRQAACLVRLTYQLALDEWEWERRDDDHPCKEPLISWESAKELEKAIAFVRAAAVSEREELKGAIRTAARPCLPSTFDEERAWLNRCSHEWKPAPRPLPEVQRQILKALDGKAMALKELGVLLNREETSLLRDHINPLRGAGCIQHDRSVGGYFRPDRPPSVD
jgi:hypothetical protein